MLVPIRALVKIARGEPLTLLILSYMVSCDNSNSRLLFYHLEKYYFNHPDIDDTFYLRPEPATIYFKQFNLTHLINLIMTQYKQTR